MQGFLLGKAPKFAAAFAAACALSFALVGNAWALDVIPVQSTLDSGSAGAKIVNVLDFTGTEGETVFVTVKAGDALIANMLPHALGDAGASTAKEGEFSADVFALRADSVDQLAGMLEAGIAVSVYGDRAGKDVLYEGQVYPVYAEKPTALCCDI